MPNEPDWRDFVNAATIRRNIRAVYARLRRAGRLPSLGERRLVNAHLRRLANRAIVIHFDDVPDMIEVLRLGRFQSLRELGRGDPAYLALRARTEETLFGPRPAGTPDPIYGILTETGYGYDLDGYGKLAIILKENVRRRSTLARADSMNSLSGYDFSCGEALTAVVPVLAPSLVVIPLLSLDDTLAATSIDDLHRRMNNDYFEVQIHGGVSIGDIEKIEIKGGMIIPRELERWAQLNNIPLT